jgi:hypothetical protein
MKTFFVVAVLVASLLAGAKHERVLSRLGLTGSCQVVETFADGTQWEACKSGRLEGAPSLAGQGCTTTGVTNKVEFWHCPAAVETSVAAK